MAVRTMDQNIMDLWGIILKRCIQIKVDTLLQSASRIARLKLPFVTQDCQPHDRNGSLVDTSGLIRYHQILIKLHLVAKTVAVRAGAKGIVKGKASRFYLFNADSAVRTGKALAEGQNLFPDSHPPASVHQKAGSAVSNRIGQALLDPRLHHQTVHHDLNVMLHVFIQHDLLRQFIEISVNPDPDKSTALCLIQNLFMSPLFALEPPVPESGALTAPAVPGSDPPSDQWSAF